MARVSLLMIPVSVLAALVALKRLLTMSRALFVSHLWVQPLTIELTACA